jgi:outer membrane usher protein
LPVVTGSGEVRMVVRDMLGREQVVTQPFYSSSGLLAEGLHDYSYEMGVERQNFGIDSNDYANWAAVGTHRLGVNDSFTAELHMEVQSQLRDAGLTGLYLFPQWGMLNATVAASQASGTSNSSSGALAAIGFERQAQPISFSLHSQWTSPGFRQLGLTNQQFAPSRQLSSSAAYATQGRGSFGVSYLRQDVRAQANVGITTLSYSVDSKRYGTLSLSAMASSGGAGNSQQLALIWTLPLGKNRNVSVTQNNSRSNAQGSSQATVATLQQSAPVGPGYGYMLQAQDTGAVRADVRYQNNVASFDAGWDHTATQDAMTAGARGGVALLGGQAYLNRWISDSFGVARVAGFPNVRVYANNQLVGITDANGDAPLPQLHPYESNQISIDARDLPMNAQVDALRVQAVPYLRSGVLAEFPVRAAYGAVFRVRIQNNLPLPAGATVELFNGKTRFPVVNDGEVYVTGLSENNRMVARWKQQSCEFEVKFSTTDDPAPDLGEFSCKGISP